MAKKYCIVPRCFNSSIKTPEKLFFNVPMDPKVRKKWMTAVQRVDSIGPKTVAFCCEDHFNVENDMDSYVKHKLVGGPLKLKKDVVPHKFACQNRLVAKPERSVIAKLKTAKLETKLMENVASTSHNVEQLYIVDPVTVTENINIVPLEDTAEDTTTEDSNIIKKKYKKVQVKLKTQVSHKGTETDSKYFSLPPKDKIIEVKNRNRFKMNNQGSTDFEEKSLISKKTVSDYGIHKIDVTDSEFEFNKYSFKNYMLKAKRILNLKTLQRVTTSHTSTFTSEVSMLDNDVFIDVIKKNPVLWKTSDKNHKNKMLLKKFWEDLQANMFPNVTVDDLKKRWKNLKDQYRKELKRMPQSSPGVPLTNVSSQWRYFELLSFLRDELGPIGSGSSLDSNYNATEYENSHLQATSKSEVYEVEIQENYEPKYELVEQISTKSDEEYEPQKDSKKRPISNKIREEMMEIERKKLKLIEDEVKRNTLERTDNYHFFMSLLPEVEKLPALQKMRFRSKVTTALIEELTALQHGQVPQHSPFNSQQSAFAINHSIDIKEEPNIMYE